LEFDMPIGSLISGGLGLLGGIIGGNSAEDAAYAQAAGQTEAARLAAEESRFRPIGITTRFGTSQFETGPDGRVSGASYTLDPQLRAMQDRFLGLAGGGLTQAEQAQRQFAPLGQAAQGLFGLGQQYLAQSPQEAAQQFMSQQQNLLAPSRERQFAQLQNQLFQTGRGGLSVGATGERPSGAAGLGAASPEMEAYYNALAQQDAALAANAMQAGQQQTAFGAGLFGTGGNLLTQGYGGQAAALGPYQAYLQGATGLEALGQQPLDMGSALGGRNVNQAGAQALLAGGLGAAQTMGAANAYNPFATALVGASQNKQLTNALANQFNPYGGTPQGAYGQQGQYLAGAFANPQTQQAQMLAAQNFGF
jgi:hypothetical protein